MRRRRSSAVGAFLVAAPRRREEVPTSRDQGPSTSSSQQLHAQHADLERFLEARRRSLRAAAGAAEKASACSIQLNAISRGAYRAEASPRADHEDSWPNTRATRARLAAVYVHAPDEKRHRGDVLLDAEELTDARMRLMKNPQSTTRRSRKESSDARRRGASVGWRAKRDARERPRRAPPRRIDPDAPPRGPHAHSRCTRSDHADAKQNVADASLQAGGWPTARLTRTQFAPHAASVSRGCSTASVSRAMDACVCVWRRAPTRSRRGEEAPRGARVRRASSVITGTTRQADAGASSHLFRDSSRPDRAEWRPSFPSTCAHAGSKGVPRRRQRPRGALGGEPPASSSATAIPATPAYGASSNQSTRNDPRARWWPPSTGHS